MSEPATPVHRPPAVAPAPLSPGAEAVVALLAEVVARLMRAGELAPDAPFDPPLASVPYTGRKEGVRTPTTGRRAS